MSIRIPAQRPATGPAAATAVSVPSAEPGWGRVLRVSVARVALTLVGMLVVWSLLPILAGWTPRVILSGSMEPRVHVGDVVVTREVPGPTIAEGQVLTVADPDHPGRTRTHRVLSRDGETLVLKGDANQAADSSTFSVDDVQGVGVVRVPYVGLPAYWLAERNWLALGVTGLVLGWCFVGCSLGARRRDDEAADGPSDDQPGPGADSTSRPRSRRVVTTVAVAAAAFGVSTGAAQAAFLHAAPTPVSTLAAATTFRPYQGAVTADAPYFFWRLDEASGTVVDDQTANNRNGTLVSTTSSWFQRGALASEPYSTALSTTVARINANTTVAGPTTFTVEAWVRTSSTTGGRILGFGDRNGSTNSTKIDRQLYLAPTGKAYFGIGTAKTTIASLAALNDNAWHHVVGTYATGTNGMKLYVDGVLQGQATATTQAFTGYWRAGAESMTGWAGNPSNANYDGTLDELAVYTKVLTPTRVQAHYTAGTTP